MKASSPAEVFVDSVDVLLFISEHEPIHTGNDKITDYGQSIQQVMSRLNKYGVFRCLQRVPSKVGSIIGCVNAGNERHSGKHERPVSKGNEKAIEVHKAIVSNVATKDANKHEISHSLGSIYMAGLI